MRARCGFLTHGIAVHFERRAATGEIDALTEEILTAERKSDTHRVLERRRSHWCRADRNNWSTRTDQVSV